MNYPTTYPLPLYASPLTLAPGPYTGPRSGLLYLRESVADYFKANAIDAEIAQVGLKYRSFNAAGVANRIVIIPGDFDGSAVPKARPYGSLSKATGANSGFNPREIASWARVFTISIWGAQPAGKEQNPEAALEICENLLEQIVRAVFSVNVAGSATTGAFDLQEVFDNSPVENAFGCELLVKCVVQSPLFDRTYDVAQGQVGKLTKEIK